MIPRHLTPALAVLLLLGAPAAPGADEVEQAIRRGEPARALQLLEATQTSLSPAEAAYWKGQALARLGRPEAAADAFRHVPADHPLYPYAARGLLHCARHSERLSLESICSSLLADPHPEVSRPALAMLAEHRLRYGDSGGASLLPRLEALAAEQAELQPLVKLLGLHTHRLASRFDEGISYARTLEHDAALSPTMRQRVRLDLAELYYDKEKAQGQALPVDDGADPDDGKGEETLLQFITANPDSPLLAEAFRRLCGRGASAGSEYTRQKLIDWAEDTAHPKRAALALASLHRELPPGAEASSLASRASANLPGEPATQELLLEHTRKLLEIGKNAEAESYLTLLQSLTGSQDSARSLFFRAALQMRSRPGEALALFMQCSQSADAALYTPALVNALICSMWAGNTSAEQALLAAPVPAPTRRELLLAHAGLLLRRDPARARAELQEVKSLSPTPQQEADVRLDEAYLSLSDQPSETLESLLSIPAAEKAQFSDDQMLRYASLVEKAMELCRQPGVIPFLTRLYDTSSSLPLKEALALHIADLYSRSGHHREALKILTRLAQLQPAGAGKAATLLYAGHEAAQQGNLAGLHHAIRLYADSARQGSPLSARATIEQAAILVRINRATEAFDLLSRLEHSTPPLTPENLAHLYTVQADAYGMDHTPAGAAAALEACEKITKIDGVPAAWVTRSRLQHAALCTRFHRSEEALADYLAVMHSERSLADPTREHSCLLFYYAGAGAVYQLMQLERFSEAAVLADELAAWPGSEQTPLRGAGGIIKGPKSEAFARWAQSIRQTHYLPSEVMLSPSSSSAY